MAIEHIEQLPPDVMAKVVQFMEIHERVKFSRCSTALQNFVWTDRAELWTDIDLSRLDYDMQLRLTDDVLSSLLTRVNAQRVTRTLNVAGCNNLTGAFLESLNHSQTLEKLYLQQGFPGGGGNVSLDENVAVRYLRSMLPFNKLSLVRFYHTLPNQPNVATEFLRELRAGQLQRARDENLSCSACELAVVDESKQVVANIDGMPPLFCGGKCKRPFCRRSSCPKGLTQCKDCRDAFCKKCKRIERCKDCGDTFCDDCERIERCDSCKRSYCEGCRYVRSCTSCSRGSCDNCRQDNGDVCSDCNGWYCDGCGQDAFLYCDGCQMGYCVDCKNCNVCDDCKHAYCDGCRETERCDSCKGWYCGDEECRDVRPCASCSSEFCDKCRHPFSFFYGHVCSGCDEWYCEDCSSAVWYCEGCEESYCVDCGQMSFICDHCSGSCCEHCRELVLSDDGSEKTFCMDCKTPKQCDGCFEILFEAEIESCGTCLKSFCGNCREMKHCERCLKTFCDDDCAFVDRCGQCETHYCDKCALVVRCPWCGEASCEKCRQNGGGFCRMCSEKPPKKARKQLCSNARS